MNISAVGLKYRSAPSIRLHEDARCFRQRGDRIRRMRKRAHSCCCRQAVCRAQLLVSFRRYRYTLPSEPMSSLVHYGRIPDSSGSSPFIPHPVSNEVGKAAAQDWRKVSSSEWGRAQVCGICVTIRAVHFQRSSLSCITSRYP